MIRQATVEDLPRMGACAEKFYATSKFLNGFDLERFCALWGSFLANDMGVIFLLTDDANEVRGALGGLKTCDLYSGERYAGELFWWVEKGSRGSGLKLYRAFEQWARDQNCSRVQMVHLQDSMSDKLERVYKHLGFEEIERHYSKSLT